MSPSAVLRLVFALVIGLSMVTVAHGYATTPTSSTFESHLDGDGVRDERTRIAPPASGITVVATDSNSWLGERGEGPRARAELVAFDPNGRVLYYNDTHTRYWDVDPVPGEPATVEALFADHLNESECPTEWDPAGRGVDKDVWERYESAQQDIDACTRNGVERVNLETGETEVVWSRVTPGKSGTRYHDVDRIDETRLVVADIFLDRVYVVNTETDEVEWTWNATSTFPTNAGGPYPKDWTHINDVEVLDDGRFMVSLRNQDQIVFLNRNGVIDGWTLGEDEDHSVMYEQHNPDFIPAERGGPAVVVADSINNRLVEYQREDGAWTETWTWRDDQLKWPRDADRLPNGHTLVTDSNGNRVFEIDREGTIVWSVRIAFGYEAERLETGDESTGGPSATFATISSRDSAEPTLDAVENFLPRKYLNDVLYVTPVWFGMAELFALLTGMLCAAGWGGLELYRFVTSR